MIPLSRDERKEKCLPMLHRTQTSHSRKWRGVEMCHLLLGSIVEVPRLLSTAVGRLAASTCSRLRLLFPDVRHCGSARTSFCAWPAIHHCGGHCQDRPGLLPGRSTPRPGASDR